MKIAFHPSTPAELQTLPSLRGTPRSSGFDLRVASFLNNDGATLQPVEDVKTVSIPPGGTAWVEFHISLDLGEYHRIDEDDGTTVLMAALVLPRSGLGSKGLGLMNTVGLIDNDYNKPIRARLVNRGSSPIDVNLWDRVAQLVLVPTMVPPITFVSSMEDTGRGGFGSTGVA